MPLSHEHNKVLYASPTIAKALSLSVLPGGKLPQNAVTQLNACGGKSEEGVSNVRERPFEPKESMMKWKTWKIFAKIHEGHII